MAFMETTIDRFGRVVIPKRLREEHGLHAGSTLVVEESQDGIVLRPAVEEMPLVHRGGVLVFAGRATADIRNAVRSHREARVAEVGRTRRR
jgi:AbrB family looped-hinge helix DNA binding protein